MQAKEIADSFWGLSCDKVFRSSYSSIAAHLTAVCHALCFAASNQMEHFSAQHITDMLCALAALKGYDQRLDLMPAQSCQAIMSSMLRRAAQLQFAGGNSAFTAE